MIAVDTNVLVASHRSDSPRHQAALRAVRSVAEDRSPWGLPFHCLVEFAAVVTNPRIFARPSTAGEVDAQVQAWTASPSVRVLTDTPGTWSTLARLLRIGDVRGAAVHDARVAAVCLGHDVTLLWTADRDYERFPLLRTENPLRDT